MSKARKLFLPPGTTLLLPPGATSTVTPSGIALHDREAGNEVTGPLKVRDFPLLPKRADGWWWRTPFDGWPESGPYATRDEAAEARDSFVRNWIGNFRRGQVSTDRERRPSKPTPSKKKGAKS